MEDELYQSLSIEDMVYMSYEQSNLPEMQELQIQEMQNARITKLIAIKVQDFKSFQGEHYIGPFMQFTGVVGPNGGGKSNVVDSVSFVFGLAYPQIRCTNQSQIIYNPDYYSDQSDLNQDQALVELEFEVENYKEPTLTLTRAIDVRARTQVFIGQYQVTQKQFNWFLIKNQFIIPAKNFLLSQSEGDRMLKLTSMEFSQFIELVSGSVQYKQEMEVVAKKNDEYLDSIAKDIKERGIVRQKQRSIQSGLQEVEKIHQINQMIDQFQKTISLLKLLDVERQINDLKKENSRDSQEVQEEIKELDKQQLQQENVINNLEIRIEDLQVQLNQKKAKENLMAFDKDQTIILIDKIKQQINQVKSRMQQEFKEKKSLLEEYEMSTYDLGLKEDQLRVHADKRIIKLSDKVIEEYRQLKKIFDQENSEVKMQLVDIKSKQKTYESIIDNAGQEIKEYKQQIKLYQENIYNYQEDLEKHDLEQQSIQKTLQLNIERLVNLQMKQQTEQHEIKKLQGLNEKLGREIILYILKEAHNERDRQHQMLMAQLKQKVPNFLGDVASLCNPTQAIYAVPLKLAFGQAKLSSYVVKTVEALKETEKYLLTQYTSKMVIIVETIKPFQDEKNTKEKLSACLKAYKEEAAKKAFLAYELVVSDLSLEDMYKQLLKGIVICSTFKLALHIRNSKVPGVTTIITLDGKSINIGGSIVSSGNSDRFARMRTFRKNDIQNDNNSGFNQDKINKSIIENKEKIEQIRSGGVVNEIRNISIQKASDEDALNRITGYKQIIAKQIKDAESEIKELTARLKETQIEFDLKTKQYEKLEQKKTTLEQEVMQKQKVAFKDFTKLHKVEHDELEQLDSQNQHQEEIDIKQNQINKLKVVVQDKKNEITQKDQRIKEAQQNIEQLEEQLAKLNDQRKQSLSPNQRTQSFEEQIKQIRNQLKQEHSKLKEIMDKKVELRTEVQIISSRRLNKQKTMKFLAKKRERIINEANQNNIKLFKRDLRQQLRDEDSLDESNLDTSGIDQDQLKTTQPIKESILKYDGYIKRKEKEIQDIVRNTLKGRPDGAVLQRDYDQHQQNLDKLDIAIDKMNKDYKSSKERYDELRKLRKQVFMNFIGKLGQNLVKIYNVIFPGYYANPDQFLFVEDQEDPYDQGVTYNACPPDKRLVQNQSEQLSGGEKQLASFALLVSINKIIGLRLFMLDEVDSNLDPENREKLIQILKLEKEELQVIMVSHNPDSFVNTQSLIGITIQGGKNTSEAFSIQLDESEEQSKIQNSVSLSVSRFRSSQLHLFQD